MASKKGTNPLVLVWKRVRTPAALNCASTAPAAVPWYISGGRAGDASPTVAPAACGGAASARCPIPSAIPDAAVAARNSRLETVSELFDADWVIAGSRVRDFPNFCQYQRLAH